MDKVIKNKRGLELITKPQNKFGKNQLFVIYYLTKFGDVM